VRTYAQTTGLWARGVLSHEYGVDLDKVTWLTIDDAHLAEHTDPPNCQRIPKGKKLGDLLFAGEVSAVIMGADMPDDPRIKTLIPNAQEEGKKWSARVQAIPINHIFAVRRELSKQRPDVVREIFRQIVESRAAAPAKGNIPPFGLEANRKAIQMAIDWSYEQKIIPRRLSVDECFDETTAGLTP
jgi:4,5-dihydroxyphthalate decarboxylase